jgi:hypothetical protein
MTGSTEGQVLQSYYKRRLRRTRSCFGAQVVPEARAARLRCSAASTRKRRLADVRWWLGGGNRPRRPRRVSAEGRETDSSSGATPREAGRGAGGGNRTHTGGKAHRILSPARLPVSPLRPGGEIDQYTAVLAATLLSTAVPSEKTSGTPVTTFHEVEHDDHNRTLASHHR